jgi:hypothetical protein
VARELERRWDETLRRQRHVEDEYDRFCHEQPSELTAAQRATILRLSQDVSRIWHAAATTSRDRQEIIRLVLDQVTVRVEGESEEVDVALDWAGGFVSRHRLVRPVARYEQLSNYPLLRARIDILHRQGSRCSEIARCLNAEGFRPPKRTMQFTTAMVARFLGSQGLHGTRPRAMSDAQLLQEHEYWLTDLARQLNIPVATLHKWQRVGWIQSRKVPVAGGRWAIWADADELARLHRLRAYRRQWPEPRYPAALTTPKPRANNA